MKRFVSAALIGLALAGAAPALPALAAPPTATPTRTKTATPTSTPSRTRTPAATQTPTVTNTPTVTQTPTITSTPTVTRTPTTTPTSTPAPTSYSALVTGTSGVKDYYRLDESTGATAHDSAGSRNGAINGSVSYGTSGAIKNDSDTSMTFNGSSAYVAVPSASAAFAGGPVTLEGWAVLPNAPSHDSMIFGFRNDSNADFYVVQQANANTLHAVYRNSSGSVWNMYTTTVTPGVWHELTLTFDGTFFSLYVDCSLIGNALAGGTIGDGSQTLYIADDSHSDYLAGTLDEVALYNVALSSSQIGARCGWGNVGAAPAIATATPTNTPTATSTPTIVTAISPPPLTFPTAVLNGDSLSLTSQESDMSIAESSTNGWHATVSNSQWQAGSHALPSTALQVGQSSGSGFAGPAIDSSASNTGTSCSNSWNFNGTPSVVDSASATAVTFFQALAGACVGSYFVNVPYTLTVPPDTHVGSYTTTLTFTLVAGP